MCCCVCECVLLCVLCVQVCVQMCADVHGVGGVGGWGGGGVVNGPSSILIFLKGAEVGPPNANVGFLASKRR